MSANIARRELLIQNMETITETYQRLHLSTNSVWQAHSKPQAKSPTLRNCNKDTAVDTLFDTDPRATPRLYNSVGVTSPPIAMAHIFYHNTGGR